MALFGKKKVAPAKPEAFDKTNEIKKLSVFITIVNKNQGDAVSKIFQRIGVSAQFIQRGEGTATAQIKDILGIEDNGKDIVISIIKKESIPEAKAEIEAFFAASKHNKGIGFTIPLTSVAGVKIYKFLTNTL